MTFLLAQVRRRGAGAIPPGGHGGRSGGGDYPRTVYEPQLRARLETTAQLCDFCKVVDNNKSNNNTPKPLQFNRSVDAAPQRFLLVGMEDGQEEGTTLYSGTSLIGIQFPSRTLQ